MSFRMFNFFSITKHKNIKKNRQTTLSLPRILSYFSLNTGLDSMRWYQPYFRAKVWKASTVVFINSIRFRSVITFFLTSVKDISLYLARLSRNKSTTFCKRMEWNLMNKVFLHYHYLKTTACWWLLFCYYYFFGHMLLRDAFRPIACEQEYQIDYNQQ